MSSQYSVLHPNYRGIKKFNVIATVQFAVEANFTDYKGVKLSERMGYLIYGDKFNKLMVQLDGEEALIKVKEASYKVLEDDYNVGIIDALISFDIFANSSEEATEKMQRTLEGDIVINNFTLSDADTDNMEFECDVLSYQFDDNYLIKEITKYDETPKKYDQLASLKVLVKGDIPSLIEGIIPEDAPECFHEWNVPYKSEDLLDNENYKFEGFTMSINGLKKIDYKLLPISFKVLEDGLAEFYFAFNFLNVNGYSPDHASDVFESIFTPDNITINDFTFIDDENFITTKLEVVNITATTVEEVAQ
ncbi:hypothetical protein ACQKMI_10565 [Lysinibacillus sp. NPDC097214]|uniref:hypothetical protein n=1 Tax=Lysinibacillus sp. NPDC097214 TaxID=3390584 RepID=UPI003D03D84E